MTLTARAAVAITPPWLWSMPEVPTWVLIVMPGLPSTTTRCTPGCPSGGYGQSGAAASVEPVDVFHRDHHVPAAHAFDREANGGNPTGLDIHHGALDQFGRDPLLDPLPDLSSSIPRSTARLRTCAPHIDDSTPGENMIGV